MLGRPRQMRLDAGIQFGLPLLRSVSVNLGEHDRGGVLIAISPIADLVGGPLSTLITFLGQGGAAAEYLPGAIVALRPRE